MIGSGGIMTTGSSRRDTGSAWASRTKRPARSAQSWSRCPVAACGIDTAGHHTQSVYDYVHACVRRKLKVYALRGGKQPDLPIVGRPSRNNRHRVPLFTVGTIAAKDLIYSRLKIENPGPGYCHFNFGHDDEFFAQLTAERVVPAFVKGVKVRRYHKIRERNEALDCRVYGMATLRILNPNWGSLERGLRKRAADLLAEIDEGEPPSEAQARQDAARRKRRKGRRGGWVKGY